MRPYPPLSMKCDEKLPWCPCGNRLMHTEFERTAGKCFTCINALPESERLALVTRLHARFHKGAAEEGEPPAAAAPESKNPQPVENPPPVRHEVVALEGYCVVALCPACRIALPAGRAEGLCDTCISAERKGLRRFLHFFRYGRPGIG